MSDLSGFLLINKPAGITSFQCVAAVRRIVGRSYKVGHTGTLDFFASGLLIIAVSRCATRHIESLMHLDKQYQATAKLGELTDTLDRTGIIQASCDLPMLVREDLEIALKSFGNSYLQTPPIFSALKFEGKRISTLAREGVMCSSDLEAIIALKRRIITFHALELISYKNPFFEIRAHVSSGAYIRSLINDIAQKLGTHATTYELKRTHIGPYNIADAVELRALDSLEMVEKSLIPIAQMFDHLG